MNTNKAQMIKALAKKTNEELIYAIRLLNLRTDPQEIIVCALCSLELETRIPDGEFKALMHECEEQLNRAMHVVGKAVESMTPQNLAT